MRGFAILLAIYCAIVYLFPKPDSVKPEGWRLFGIFISTVVGSIIEPIPGGALVLLAVTLSSILGVGGGVVKVPVLHIFCGMPMKAAAADRKSVV